MRSQGCTPPQDAYDALHQLSSRQLDGLALKTANGSYLGLDQADHGFPGKLSQLLRAGPEALNTAAYTLNRSGMLIDPARCALLPPITAPGKMIRVFPSYPVRSREANCEKPACASLSTCSRTSLIGHDTPLRQPGETEFLGYEGELVVVMGRAGKFIANESALSYIAGYTIFSSPAFCGRQDSTPHWKANQRFDGDGAIGSEFVTADEVPYGATGLRIQIRINNRTLWDMSTSHLVFDVATAVFLVSDAMPLETGICSYSAGHSALARFPCPLARLNRATYVESKSNELACSGT